MVFFLAKKSSRLLEPVEWDRVRDNSSGTVGLDQLHGRSAGGLETGLRLSFFLPSFFSELVADSSKCIPGANKAILAGS